MPNVFDEVFDEKSKGNVFDEVFAQSDTDLALPRPTALGIPVGEGAVSKGKTNQQREWEAHDRVQAIWADKPKPPTVDEQRAAELEMLKSWSPPEKQDPLDPLTWLKRSEDRGVADWQTSTDRSDKPGMATAADMAMLEDPGPYRGGHGDSGYSQVVGGMKDIIKGWVGRHHGDMAEKIVGWINTPEQAHFQRELLQDEIQLDRQEHPEQGPQPGIRNQVFRMLPVLVGYAIPGNKLNMAMSFQGQGYLDAKEAGADEAHAGFAGDCQFLAAIVPAGVYGKMIPGVFGQVAGQAQRTFWQGARVYGKDAVVATVAGAVQGFINDGSMQIAVNPATGKPYDLMQTLEATFDAGKMNFFATTGIHGAGAAVHSLSRAVKSQTDIHATGMELTKNVPGLPLSEGIKAATILHADERAQAFAQNELAKPENNVPAANDVPRGTAPGTETAPKTAQESAKGEKVAPEAAGEAVATFTEDSPIGRKLRRFHEDEAGQIDPGMLGKKAVLATAETVRKAHKSLREVARDALDVIRGTVLPKLTRSGAADAAVEHASAGVAAPHIVKDLLAKVFPDQYHDPEAMSKTRDVLNKDNILGGYDEFVRKHAQEQQKADDYANPQGAIADIQTMIDDGGLTPEEIAKGKKYIKELQGVSEEDAAHQQKKADETKAAVDAIAKSHDIDQYAKDVQDALKDPTIKGNIDRWKEHVQPLLDQWYNEAKRQDPGQKNDGRGRYTQARVNLLTEQEAAKWGTWLKNDDKTNLPTADEPGAGEVKQSSQGGASSYRNPNVKKDAYMRQAFFTGQYSTDPTATLMAVIARRYNEVTKLRFYDALKDAGAVEVRAGETPPEDIGDKVRMAIKVPETDPSTGITKMVESSLYVDKDHVGEIRDVLNTDQRVVQSRAARILTSTQILGIADLTTHSHNLVAAVANAQGADVAWQEVTRKIPGIKTADGLARIISVAHEVMQDSPGVRAEIADMAKKGLIRPDYHATGILAKGGKFLHSVDTAGRVILNRFFDTLVERGQAKDTPQNRRQFVNQLGNYNRRLMKPFSRFLRDIGASPFIVAGQTFNRLGRRLVTGGYGFEAANRKAAIVSRVMQLASGVVGTAALTSVLNYLTTGKAGGRPGTPLGAWDYGGEEDKDDKHSTVDFMQLDGLRRGMRGWGIDAGIEQYRKGATAEHIMGEMAKQVVQTAIHPYTGPAVTFGFEAATGRGTDMRMKASQMQEGGPQQIENFRQAVSDVNPPLYSFLRPIFQKMGLDQRPSDKTQGQDFLDSFLKAPKSALGVKDVRGTTAAEDKALEFIKARMSEGMTPEQEARYLAKKRMRGDTDAIDTAYDNGEITKREHDELIKDMDLTRLERMVKHLTPLEALKVWDAATPKERSELDDAMEKKFKNAIKNAADKDKPAISREYEARGL